MVESAIDLFEGHLLLAISGRSAQPPEREEPKWTLEVSNRGRLMV
jgi:hypothetical protein